MRLAEFAPEPFIRRQGLDPTAGAEQLPPRLLPELLRSQRRALAAQKGWARRRRDWDGYLALHGHSDVAPAFFAIASELGGAEFWKLLGAHVWDRTEQFRPRELWAGLLQQHPAQRGEMMTPGERGALARLPEEITAFRGAGRPEDLSGFSWTLDRRRAEFFALRFSGARAPMAAARLAKVDPEHADRPVVACGRVSKRDVIAYRAARREKEIIVLPEAVEILELRDL